MILTKKMKFIIISFSRIIIFMQLRVGRRAWSYSPSVPLRTPFIFAYLTDGLNPRAWWWELLTMFRKAALLVSVTVVDRETIRMHPDTIRHHPDPQVMNQPTSITMVDTGVDYNPRYESMKARKISARTRERVEAFA